MGRQWDPMLYAGAARYYAQGRMPYPAGTAEALRTALDLDGRGRLLDVGCGPGSLTLPLAAVFDRVVGVDADADMIEVARSEAARAGIRNVEWRVSRAERLPPDLGTFRVVSFAQSFHWFDRPVVAAAVARMLEPGGAVVLVGATTHVGVAGDDPMPHPRPPTAEVDDLLRRWLGPVRRAGQGLLPEGTAGGEEEFLRAAGLTGPDRIDVPGGVRRRTEDEVVAAVFSLSYAAPHLFGDRVDAFEAELRALLRRTSPDGRFSERQREVTLSVYRPAATAGPRPR